MKYAFRFKQNGVVCMFEEHDVAGMRRSADWEEVISENPEENAPPGLEEKIVKVLGVQKVNKSDEKRGPGRPRKAA